ncbi:MAG: tetratricopeptide repeat protein [Phenylobacterium sp.]|uniref:tetratricopeptide repeat protein n=1 Tax=Phenylobacterium sp. TaxID=1871053 RepID=UPI00391C61DC
MDQRIVAADAALKAGRQAEAIALLISVLEELPDQPLQVYRVLCRQLFFARRFEEGATWTARATARFSRDDELWNLHGVMLRQTRRHDEALKAFDQAIRLNPKNMSAQNNKGNVYNDLGDGPKAEAIFAKLARLDPRNAEVHRALGRALRNQGKHAAAAARFRQTVALKKDSVDGWLDLSAVEADIGRMDAAFEILDKAMEHCPDAPRLKEARAAMMTGAGQFRAVEAYLNEVIAQGGDAAWVQHRLGAAMAEYDRPRANTHLRRAVEMDPANVEARLRLAESLSRTRGPQEAANLEEAYAILKDVADKDQLEISNSKLAIDVFRRLAAYDDMEKVGGFAELGRYWATTGKHTALLQHLASVKTFEDRLELVEQHRLFGEWAEKRAAAHPINHPPRRADRSKIRVGFMSSDLRNHPVAYFALPLFEHVDRERFEIYCYSFYQGAEDATQARITQLSDAFRWRPDISDRDAAQMIADDQLDILFELGGSTHMNKLEAMAYKPAPLSASWLGYPHSAGVKAIDYLVMDPFMMPEKPGLMIEKPLMLPHAWYALGSMAFREEPAVEPTAPVERNGYVTFGTANNPYKYGREMLKVWARIVAATPNARFMFVRPEGASAIFRRNIEAIFAAEGVGRERIRFEAVRGAHLPFYGQIDISLDAFPQTGGTTTCEALWMGVPVVTLVGEAIFERLSYSVLMNLGLEDFCARSVEAYMQAATALAADPARIGELRRTLRPRMKASPLGQTHAFADDFYAAVTRTVRGEGQGAG